MALCRSTCSFTFVFEFVTDRTCGPRNLALHSTFKTERKSKPFSEFPSVPPIQRSRDLLLPWAGPYRKKFFSFIFDILAIGKTCPTKQRNRGVKWFCNSLLCDVHLQPYYNSARKGRFLKRTTLLLGALMVLQTTKELF